LADFPAMHFRKKSQQPLIDSLAVSHKVNSRSRVQIPSLAPHDLLRIRGLCIEKMA
jgi:hypothetical protein